MKEDGLGAFLIAQPLLLLVIVAVLAGTLGWRLQHSSPRAGQALRNTAYLAMVAAGLLTVADVARKANRSDAALLMHEDAPLLISGRETIVPMHDDGHFWVKATINGQPQDFMIDTGASYVSLTRSAAEAAGIAPDPGTPPLRLSTADGTMTARIGTARSIDFGSIAVRNVEVVIAPDDGGEINVIGMNLLSQLASWHVERKQLRLVPKGAEQP